MSTSRIAKSRLWIFRLAAFFLGIGVIIVLLKYVGFKRSAELILRASPYWLLGAVLLYSSSWLFRTLRLALFTIHAGKTINMFEIFKLHVAGYALNAILPARMGDFATIGFLKAQEINLTRATAIIVQTRLLDALTVVLLFMPAFMMIFDNKSLSWVYPSLLLSITIIAIPMGLVITDRNKKISMFFLSICGRAKSRTVTKIATKINELFMDFRDILMDPKLLVSSLFFSLLIWLIEGVTCYFICEAIDVNVHIAVAIGAVCCGNIGKSVSTIPGGIGVYEGIVVAFLGMFGVPFDASVIVAILDHTIKKGVNLSLGLPATAGLGLNMIKLYQKEGCRLG